MPNTDSAIRRVRRVAKQTAVNRLRKSKYKAAVKNGLVEIFDLVEMIYDGKLLTSKI